MYLEKKWRKKALKGKGNFSVGLRPTRPTPGIEPGNRMRFAIIIITSIVSCVSAALDTLPR